MQFVEGAKSNKTGQVAYTRAEAKQKFLDAAKASTKPFIYLSAGVSNAEFTEGLTLAAESGVHYSGVLCGRATWKDGMAVFAKEGSAAFRAWLETKGVDNIRNVNEAIKPASPWFSVYGVSSADEMAK
jgi:tagatose 1,6-diphosphate aldolase